jgi:probable addiction module antidote protein
LAEIFQEFAEDNDTGALLASLRVVARVQGISDIAEQIGMTRQGVQKALSDDGNPCLGNVTLIMKAMGIVWCRKSCLDSAMHAPKGIATGFIARQETDLYPDFPVLQYWFPDYAIIPK